MGKLTLARREGAKIYLSIDPEADPQDALRKILEEGITLCMLDICGKQATLTITAPEEILILREELVK